VFRSIIKRAYFPLRKICLRVAVRSDRRPDLTRNPESILVVSERRLGDVCLEIPALRTIRAAYPQAFLTVVAPDGLLPLISWACRPDRTAGYPGTDAIAKRQWDLAIDFTADYQLAPARLVAASRAPIRIGFDIEGRGRYFNVPLLVPVSEHMRDVYASVLAPLGKGLDRGPLPGDLPAPGISRRYNVAVHPGAHHATQRWPAQYFAGLVSRISSAGESCAVIGAPAEQNLVHEIVRIAGAGDAMILPDILSLAAAVKTATVLICNNSGPLHLAALLGVPTVSFMGPTVRSKWYPLGEHHAVLRRNDLPCIGCNLGYCRIGTHACMKDISPQMAYSAYLDVRSSLG
jgi:ADP-heptose:LPS heptosyltransferase